MQFLFGKTVVWYGSHFFDGSLDKCKDDQQLDAKGSSSRDLLGKPSGIVGPAVSGEGMAGAPERGSRSSFRTRDCGAPR